MYSTINQIRQANRRAGQHWFSESDMRFFGTIIESEVINGRYFITSEQHTDYVLGIHEPRQFTIRCADDDGEVATVGDFQAYATLAEAWEAARLLPRLDG